MEIIEFNCNYAQQGMNDFLRNFSYVPDDKLHWKPFPTANSAIRIAAHTALYAGRFADMIENRSLPAPETVDAWVAKNNAEEEALTDREEMISVFHSNTDRVIKVIKSLSLQDLELRLDTGQGWGFPMTQLIKFPGWHAVLHNGQIDYLQTCWGDTKIYTE